MQGLLGFKQQSMSGKKDSTSSFSLPWIYGPGSYTFTAPVSGTYEFAGWGPGDGGAAGGKSFSGALFIKALKLRRGETVAISVGLAERISNSSGDVYLGTNTPATVTWSNGVATAAIAAVTGTTPAQASGGDVNIPGNYVTGGPKAAAPSYGRYQAGPNNTGTRVATSPAGGAQNEVPAGSGLVIVSRIA